jgi:hypothetical protein
MFGVDVFPIEVATTGGNQIVASMVAGGAFGPHFTEFREQKRVLPGLIFVRTIGYSDAIGSVTFTVSSPGRVRATISGDTPMTSAVFEARVAPLAPW